MNVMYFGFGLFLGACVGLLVAAWLVSGVDK